MTRVPTPTASVITASLVAPDSRTSKLSVGSDARSPLTVTAMVLVSSPSAKLRTPLAAT